MNLYTEEQIKNHIKYFEDMIVKFNFKDEILEAAQNEINYWKKKLK